MLSLAERGSVKGWTGRPESGTTGMPMTALPPFRLLRTKRAIERAGRAEGENEGSDSLLLRWFVQHTQELGRLASLGTAVHLSIGTGLV